MDVIGGGLAMTAKNTLNRLRDIFMWILKKAGNLVLKLPIAMIRILATLGNYLLDKKNRKVMMVVLATAGVVIASRTLVN